MILRGSWDGRKGLASAAFRISLELNRVLFRHLLRRISAGIPYQVRAGDLFVFKMVEARVLWGSSYNFVVVYPVRR